MSAFSLTPDVTGITYDLFQYLSWGAMLVILLYEGWRRKYPLAAWSLSLALLLTVVILGTRLATFDAAAWEAWWRSGVFPQGGQRTAVASAVCFFLGIWLVRKGLHFRAPILVTFAFAVPATMILRRLGCLAAACCYGLPTEWGWGISYVGPSHLRDNHLSRGLVEWSDYSSALVYPVPLYFVVGGLLCYWILWRCKGRFRQAGNLTLLMMVVLLSFRFVIEFFRDPITNHQLGGLWLGLKQVQLVLLGTVIVLLAAIWLWERRPVRQESHRFPSPHRLLWGNALLAGFVFWMQDGFTFAEKACIHGYMLLSWGALLVQLLRQTQASTQRRWQTSMIALIAFGLMSQTYPYVPVDTTMVRAHYNTFKFNTNYGSVGSAHYECIQVNSGCGGTSCVRGDSINPYGPRHLPIEVGFDRVRVIQRMYTKRGIRKLWYFYTSFGIEAQGEFFQNRELGVSKFRGNVFPYFRFGNRGIELKIGARLGSIWHENEDADIPISSPINSNDHAQPNPLVFASALRVGRPSGIYLQVHSEQSPILGASTHSVGVNLNMNLNRFTNNKWQYLRIGMENVYSLDFIQYIEAGINLTNNIVITPRIGLVMRDQSGDVSRHRSFTRVMGGVGFYYRGVQ